MDPASGGRLTEEEVRSFCAERIAHFKVPKYIAFSAFPMTVTGKIQKFVMRDALVAELGLSAWGRFRSPGPPQGAGRSSPGLGIIPGLGPMEKALPVVPKHQVPGGPSVLYHPFRCGYSVVQQGGE